MAAGYTKRYAGYNNIQNNRRKRLQLALVLVTMVLLRFRIFGKGNNLCIGYHQLANWFLTISIMKTLPCCRISVDSIGIRHQVLSKQMPIRHHRKTLRVLLSFQVFLCCWFGFRKFFNVPCRPHIGCGPPAVENASQGPSASRPGTPNDYSGGLQVCGLDNTSRTVRLHL